MSEKQQTGPAKDSTRTETYTVLAKKNVQDSVFTHLFGNLEYTLQLYQSLHPEDREITQDQIRIVTLENVLLNQPYNDLGFIAGKKLLVLVEAQSTWSENILIRVLIYIVQTIQNRIIETGQNVYGSRKITFPEPEFYVVFTGTREEKPEQITLSEVFFGGKETALEVRVKMRYDGTGRDILSQYVAFTQVFKEQCKRYGRTQKAVLQTMEICKSGDILKNYLESREKEVVNIMMLLFNQEYAVEAYGEEIRQEARREGEFKVRREAALRMMKKGMEEDQIADFLGVSAGDVRQWISEDA